MKTRDKRGRFISEDREEEQTNQIQIGDNLGVPVESLVKFIRIFLIGILCILLFGPWISYLIKKNIIGIAVEFFTGFFSLECPECTPCNKTQKENNDL